MMRGVNSLLAAQFLSAFADNAILFTAIAMAMQAGNSTGWYIPAMQGAFLVAFVVLAPWVGRLADIRPKPMVLILGNAAKLLGVALILLGVDTLFAYAIVGVGAAIYSPAKYGILPELVGQEQLVKANGLIEGSTILAIVLGTVAGARVADHSIDAALTMIVIAFILSIGFTLLLPKPPPRDGEGGPIFAGFKYKIRGFFVTPRARFSMLGASLFWAAATVLRVLIVAWAPLVLGLATTADIAELTLYLAVGIIIGAGLAPRLIPIEGLRRARIAAYAMGVLILGLAGVTELSAARVVLVAIGITGGLFVVPINAALQELGHKTIGAGNAVAIQNFFENLGMLVAVGIYTVATGMGSLPVPTILVLGVVVLIATFIVSWHLPEDPRNIRPEKAVHQES